MSEFIPHFADQSQIAVCFWTEKTETKNEVDFRAE